MCANEKIVNVNFEFNAQLFIFVFVNTHKVVKI